MDGRNSIVGDAVDTATQASGGLLSELKKIGQTAIGQITGRPQNIPSDDELAKMTNVDEKFSKEAQEEIRAKIAAIYQEYAARRKKESMIVKQQEIQRDEQSKQMEEAQEKQEAEMVNPSVAKTRAEIKNYGAE